MQFVQVNQLSIVEDGVGGQLSVIGELIYQLVVLSERVFIVGKRGEGEAAIEACRWKKNRILIKI